MGLFDLFRSNSKNEKFGHLKALVALSMVDGDSSKVESALIATIAHREGLTKKDFEECLTNLPSIEYVIPKDNETKVKYLKDMVALMMCDGDIDDNELSLCKITAKMFGYREEVIDAMMLDIIKDLKRELNL